MLGMAEMGRIAAEEGNELCMRRLPIEEAQAHLAELIAGLTPDQEIIITSNDQPVAELRPLPVKVQPRFGSCKGSLEILAEDDERLKDFAEYMQ
jgi:antitoxin (DNA-binding transcriptional repressor) of toxin-antitoxin stability system